MKCGGVGGGRCAALVATAALAAAELLLPLRWLLLPLPPLLLLLLLLLLLPLLLTLMLVILLAQRMLVMLLRLQGSPRAGDGVGKDGTGRQRDGLSGEPHVDRPCALQLAAAAVDEREYRRADREAL